MLSAIESRRRAKGVKVGIAMRTHLADTEVGISDFQTLGTDLFLHPILPHSAEWGENKDHHPEAQDRKHRQDFHGTTLAHKMYVGLKSSNQDSRYTNHMA